jgi:curved DNA-binding protein CbpA
MDNKEHMAVPLLTFALEGEGEVRYRLEMSPEERKVLIFLAVSGEPENFEALTEATQLERAELVKVLAGLSVKGIIKRTSVEIEEDEEEEEEERREEPAKLTIAPEPEKGEAPEEEIIDYESEVAAPDKEPARPVGLAEEELVPEALQTCLESLREKNYYDVLGVSPQAKKLEIRRVYYDLVSKYHPDQHRDVEEELVQKLLGDIFSLITQAYETLYHKKRRYRYDRTIPEVTGVEESEEEEALAALFEEAAPEAPVDDRQAENQPPGWSFYESALDAFKMGDHHAADLNFKLAVGMEPDRPEYQEGLKRNTEILSKRLLEDLRRDAKRLEEGKNFKEAVAALTRAVELDPEDPDLWYALAKIRFLKTMDRDKAEEDLSWALALDPKHVDSLLLLGRMHVWKGNTGLAVETFKEVLTISPGHPKAEQALELFEN